MFPIWDWATSQNVNKPKRRQTKTSTNRNVDKPKPVCRRFSVSTFWCVDVVFFCCRFGLSTFRFVDVLVCRRLGLSTFRFVEVLTSYRLGDHQCAMFSLELIDKNWTSPVSSKHKCIMYSTGIMVLVGNTSYIYSRKSMAMEKNKNVTTQFQVWTLENMWSEPLFNKLCVELVTWLFQVCENIYKTY